MRCAVVSMKFTVPVTVDGVLGDGLPRMPPRSPRPEEPHAASRSSTASVESFRIQTSYGRMSKDHAVAALAYDALPGLHRSRALLLGGASVRHRARARPDVWLGRAGVAAAAEGEEGSRCGHGNLERRMRMQNEENG